jgi:hypothetical protein
MMDLSADGLFLVLIDLHSNRLALAQQLKEVMASESLEN